MLSLNVHVRQILGSWHLTAVLVRDHGAGLEPETATAVWDSPLTAAEWDDDDLSAVLGAIARWSGLTIESKRLHD